MALGPKQPPEAIVVRGRVVSFDQPVLDHGAVYVGADEHIHAVQDASAPAPAGFASARVVETGGAIYPGLIDLHNHIAYNGLSLWTPPGRTKPYTARTQWPNDKSYDPLISDPGKLLGYVAGKAQLKYAETKALLGGVTAIQGSARTGHPYEGWLVRNIEEETFTSGRSTVFQSVITLHKTRAADPFPSARAHTQDGNSFIYHLSEGSSPNLVSEYAALRDNDCLHPGLIGIHCTALGHPNFDEWSPHGGAIVWSPFSNLWLYGTTTDVVAARAAGMRVCLGADWSPSGSKSLLGELKVADLHNRQALGGAFSAQELCEMATCNPADALQWGDRIGRLKEGLRADLLVVSDRGGDPYRNLIESTERDVRLVAINGYPMYGSAALMRAANAYGVSEPCRTAAGQRRIRLVYDWIEDADWGFKTVLSELAAARADPKRYLDTRPHAKGLNVALHLDKPFDVPKDINLQAVIPPLDSLTHDAAFFAAVEAGGFHGGQLDGLAAYYT